MKMKKDQSLYSMGNLNFNNHKPIYDTLIYVVYRSVSTLDYPALHAHKLNYGLNYSTYRNHGRIYEAKEIRGRMYTVTVDLKR